ncbi:MAG: rRNA maturation RNase YbeY [Bermanella sp.]
MIIVDMQIASEHSELPNQEQLTAWAQAALQGLKDEAELSIRLVDEAESQQLNLEYRGQDKPTNVLSFPFEVPEALQGLDEVGQLIGDLVICAQVVADEATLQHKPAIHHWAHMVVHGCLHLLGYDHITDAEAQVMEDMERTILGSLNIADPYLTIE